LVKVKLSSPKVSQAHAEKAVALHFFVMVFVANAHALLCFFKRQEKNKQVQPSARPKTHAKKDGGKLNNIMNLIVFFSPAYASMPTHKKKIL
jgi:hypothetical protein